MSWFKLALGIIKILSALLGYLERRRLITQAERNLRAEMLDKTVKEFTRHAQIKKEYNDLTSQQVEELFEERGWWRKEG